MPFSGTAPNKSFARATGLQTGSTAWADTSAASRGIEAADHDSHDQDLATAINTSLQKDGANKATADIDFGGYKITTLGTPTASTDATTKAYVDAAVVAVVNATCRVATTANITIATALNNADTLDGVTLATNDRILVKNQTAQEENGIYVVDVAPARATDFDTYNEHVNAIIYVTVGTAGAGLSFRSTANTGGTLNTTAIVFAQHGSSITLPLGLSSGGTGEITAALGFAAMKQAATTSATGVVEKATDAEVFSATADKYIAADHIETASAMVVLTYGASLTFDWDAGVNRTIAMTGNATLANATNGQPGTWRTLIFNQDATGSRTLAFGTNYRFPGGTDPVLTTTASARDTLMIYCYTTSLFDVYTNLNLST